MQSIRIGAPVVYTIELPRLGRDKYVQVGRIKEVSQGRVLVAWPGLLDLDQAHPVYRPRLKWVSVGHLTTLGDSNEEA